MVITFTTTPIGLECHCFGWYAKIQAPEPPEDQFDETPQFYLLEVFEGEGTSVIVANAVSQRYLINAFKLFVQEYALIVGVNIEATTTIEK